MRLLLALMLLQGCAPLQEVQRLDSVQITWVRTEEADKECAKYLGNQTAWSGCAIYEWVKRLCTIFASAEADDAVLGHEMKHCFGWAHK